MSRVYELRPFLVLAIAFALGLAWPTHPLLLLLLPPLALVRPEETRKWRFIVNWPLLAIGLCVGTVRAPAPTPIQLESFPVAETMTVDSVPKLGVKGTQFDLVSPDGRWRAILPGRPDVSYGDRLFVRGTKRPLADGLDAFARQRGMVGRLQIDEWRVEGRGPAVAHLAESVRRPFERFVLAQLDSQTAPLVMALCLNMEEFLSEEDRDNLRATGTYHLISASGLHVFVVCGALIWVLSLLPIPRGAQLGLLAVPLVIYCLATGLEAPVLRASLMTLVGWSAYLFRRTPDYLNALGLSAFLYLLWRPSAVMEIGTQLSFVSVAGILLFSHRSEFGDGLGARLRNVAIDAVRLSTVAFVASAPLIAYYFQTVSLLAIPTNLLVGLAASAIVILGLLGFLLSWTPVGIGMLLFAGWLAASIQAITDAFHRIPFAEVAVPTFPAWIVFAIYGGLLLLWREKITQP